MLHTVTCGDSSGANWHGMLGNSLRGRIPLVAFVCTSTLLLLDLGAYSGHGRFGDLIWYTKCWGSCIHSYKCCYKTYCNSSWSWCESSHCKYVIVANSSMMSEYLLSVEWHRLQTYICTSDVRKQCSLELCSSHLATSTRAL